MRDQYEDFEKLIDAGELSTAELRLFEWIRDHPNDSYAWLLYGKCVSNPTQKRDCFKRALALDTSNTEARELLNQLEASSSPVIQKQDYTKLNPSQPSIFPALPTKVLPSSTVFKPPTLSEQAKKNLIIASYSFAHFLLTILLGIVLVFLLASSVPGLLTIKWPNDTIQRNWLSNESPSESSQALQGLAEVFLNPSRLDYREVASSQELNNFRTSLTIDPSAGQRVEFIGVSFVGQLVGGNILQSGQEGQPLVVVMDVLFGKTRIPVVYYGPSNQFNYEDTILVEGVYIEDPNGIIAQRVQRLSTNVSGQVDNSSLLMLRAAGIVMLWALICLSVFYWRLNLKRWGQANTTSFPTTTASLVLMIYSIFLAGCSIDISTTLRTDGTGLTTIMSQESRENMDFLRSAPGLSGYFSALIRDLEKSGNMFEHYIEGDQEVLVLQRYFNNSSGEPGNTYPIEGSWVYVQRYREGNEEVMRFTGVVDTRALYNTSSNIDPQVANALRDQLSQIVMNYHLNVPGSIVYNNGDNVTSQRISWQIQMGGINYLVAEVRFSSEDMVTTRNYARYTWIALSIVFVVSTLFLIASIWVRPASNRQRREP